MAAFKESWTGASFTGAVRAAAGTQLNDSQLVPGLWAVAPTRSLGRTAFARAAKQAGIKESAWRKLTSTRNREEAARQTRRIVRRLDHVPVAEIVDGIYYWGPKVRREWAVAWFLGDASGDE